MTTINCIYNCKFQKDGVCYLNSDSKIVSANSSVECPYFVKKENEISSERKDEKKPLSRFSLR